MHPASLARGAARDGWLAQHIRGGQSWGCLKCHDALADVDVIQATHSKRCLRPQTLFTQHSKLHGRQQHEAAAVEYRTTVAAGRVRPSNPLKSAATCTAACAAPPPSLGGRRDSVEAAFSEDSSPFSRSPSNTSATMRRSAGKQRARVPATPMGSKQRSALSTRAASRGLVVLHALHDDDGTVRIARGGHE